jgi:uncharacterized protein (TIGR03067 family)
MGQFMSARVALVLLPLALLGFAPAPFARTPRMRQANLAGHWEFLRYEASGSRAEWMEKEYLLSLTSTSFRIVPRQGNGNEPNFVLHLDPSASPPAFTMRRPQESKLAYVGSYRLQGSELTMVFSSGDDLSRRPTDFEKSTADWRYVMRRTNGK